MKKTLFILALISFSICCFAQQDYESEIKELKSRYNSLIVLIDNLKKENESNEEELKKEWARFCKQCIKYADYLSKEDFRALIEQTDTNVDGTELRDSLTLAQKGRRSNPIEQLKPDNEKNQNYTILSEGEGNSGENFRKDNQDDAKGMEKIVRSKDENSEVESQSTASKQNNKGNITDGNKDKGDIKDGNKGENR